MRKLQNDEKSRIINRIITQYFKMYALEVYAGHITLQDVVSAVRKQLSQHKARLTEYNLGEIYDAVREYGPTGECDDQWLRKYVQDNREMSA